MARTGFYPGSFDPVTYGHLDIIARAARLVDKLVLGVGVRPAVSACALLFLAGVLTPLRVVVGLWLGSPVLEIFG